MASTQTPPEIKTAHLCGPVHGIADALQAFEGPKLELENRGYRVTTPLDQAPLAAAAVRNDPEAVPPGSDQWCKAVRQCLAKMLGVDEVWMIPGWTQSKGAQVEAFVAAMTDIPIFEVETGKQIKPFFVLTLLNPRQAP